MSRLHADVATLRHTSTMRPLAALAAGLLLAAVPVRACEFDDATLGYGPAAALLAGGPSGLSLNGLDPVEPPSGLITLSEAGAHGPSLWTAAGTPPAAPSRRSFAAWSTAR